MYYVKFCRAPSQLWVGCVVYKNGTYFASGSTLDKLMTNVKTRLYQVDRVPFSSVVLDSKQSLPSELPTHLMSKRFKKTAWYPSSVEIGESQEIITMEKQEELTKENKMMKKQKQPTEIQNLNIVKHQYEERDGKLIVWGVIKVAEYNLSNVNNDKAVEVDDEMQDKDELRNA